MKVRLLLALALPILVLGFQAFNHHLKRNAGTEIVLPIEGFDPRDLLSGHYLIYTVNYGFAGEQGCPTSSVPATVCLQPEPVKVYAAGDLPTHCTQFIRGTCDDSARFTAGIERFYIPEKHARVLDKLVRDRKGSLVLSVTHDGNAAIRNLLIEGKPWLDVVAGDNPEK